jgi:hypothetical protein
MPGVCRTSATNVLKGLTEHFILSSTLLGGLLWSLDSEPREEQPDGDFFAFLSKRAAAGGAAEHERLRNCDIDGIGAEQRCGG